jgi:hypothetical protein
VPIVLKSGSLDLLEPSGPVKTRNGIALPCLYAVLEQAVLQLVEAQRYNLQTNVLIKEECILKNKNKLCPYYKLPVFYNSCLKTFGSHLQNIQYCN